MSPIDPRALRPAQLVRLLNSTPLGEVVRSHQVYQQRNRAGFRIGDGRTVDLVRYTSWLIEEVEGMSKRQAAGGYGEHKRQSAARQRKLSQEGRDIGPPPAVVDPKRRAGAVGSLRLFCETYYPRIFRLAWSKDHLHVIKRIEEAVKVGGLMALAMPRGAGKTCLCEAACEWAVLGGWRRYVELCAVNDTFAQKSLAGIKRRWESNELLLQDFPEVIHAVRSLDRLAGRCKGQICEGQPTYIEWGAGLILLPTMPAEVLEALGVAGANGCGAVLEAAGLTTVRGAHLAAADGSYLRPDLAIIDDPQRPDTARSPSQCRERVEILGADVLELCGPDVEMAAVMPCTVIKPGDAADEILDRDQHPEWRGERMKMIYKFPTKENLWDEYAELYRAALSDGSMKAANAFYRAHRKEMDAGAEVAWPERFKKGEVSGIQSAMNRLIKNEEAFWSECQNQPMEPETDSVPTLDADQVAGKVNNRPRGQVPVACSELTAMVDVHDKVLYWLVCAWQPDFTGYVVDYGTYPDQRRRHFTQRKAPRSIRRVHQGMGEEGALYAALQACTDELLGREWHREDGAQLRIGQCFVDQGWQTDVVHQFCRESDHAATLMPSRGAAIKATNKPISEYRRGEGDRIGFHWWIPSMRRKRALRHVEIDTYFWKSFLHDRLGTAMGDRGCLSIFGKRPMDHRLFAEHLTAEVRRRTEANGRKVDEWTQPTAKPDNHWFDCLVGCACAASMRGVSFEGIVTGRVPDKKPKRSGGWAAVQRRKTLERQKKR